MNDQVITRQNMVDAMSTEYNSVLHEYRGADWQRVNTSLLTQTDNMVTGAAINFHLLELCLEGSHFIRIESDMEHGAHVSTKMLPTAIAYVQPDTAVHQEVEGRAKLQQIYIDDTIFRDVASALAKGDPDHLKPLGFQGLFVPELRFLADKLLNEARTGRLGGELYADLLAQEIALVILRRRLEGNEKKVNVSPLSDHEIARVIDFMEANLEEVGGMDTLAQQIDMDVFAFTRAFRAKTGEAPHQFLIGRRLAHVKDMLVNTKMPLAEISYAAGFASQAHMTATFSKHIGMPPGAYRKAIKT